MQKPLKRVVVSGAAGQIAYSLIFRIAAGDLLGKDQPIALHLIEIPELAGALTGIQMELEDCTFPLVKEIRIGSDPQKLFEGVDYALLVGAKPRGPGMERKDLLAENGKIFVGQGKALGDVASKGVKVFVVGNPANTNCLIAMHHAKGLPKEQFFSMMRLDQNRSVFQLAKKAGVGIEKVSQMVVWGNHSSTQVPDFLNAKIDGKRVVEVIQDRKWLEEEFVPMIQKRGAAVITARGKSSAASAAHAVIDSIKSLEEPTKVGDFFSIARLSQGNPYGIREDLIFSFPTFSDGKGKITTVAGLMMDPFLEKKLKMTEKELVEERDMITDLLR